MKIGLISDTHNNIAHTKKALKVFQERSVELIIHAGDLTSPKMLDLFKNTNSKFVLGNADIDVEMINTQAQDLGFEPIKIFNDFAIDSKRIIVFHGDNVPMFRKAVISNDYDYIIKGHTHIFENYTSKKTRIINPGSLFVNIEQTIAILDTVTGKVEKIPIEDE